MKKNAPLAFRIPDELKKRLQHIANREARSISQICEILLTIGTEAYSKEGSKYLQSYTKSSKEA
jgi:predicted DNA-binding protein